MQSPAISSEPAVNSSPVPGPPLQRVLLFAANLYALPILRPLQAQALSEGLQVAWFLYEVDRSNMRSDERVLDTTQAVAGFAADAVLSAANWVAPFFPGLKVQVFHGFNVEKRDAGRGHFRIRGWFDLYCTQGPNTTTPFQQLAVEHAHFRVIETGWPKLDPLFLQPHPDPEILQHAAGRPVIAFGSTFTESLSAAPHVYEEIRRMVASGRWYWLLTLHPKSPPELIARYRALAGAHARFIEPVDLHVLLRSARVLVADTSSIVSEFAVQLRPVVTFRNRRPAPHMLDVTEPAALEAAIERALDPAPELLAQLQQWAGQTHPHRDGQSSARVLQAVRDALIAPAVARRKPANLLRGLQIRWRMRRLR